MTIYDLINIYRSLYSDPIVCEEASREEDRADIPFRQSRSRDLDPHGC